MTSSTVIHIIVLKVVCEVVLFVDMAIINQTEPMCHLSSTVRLIIKFLTFYIFILYNISSNVVMKNENEFKVALKIS